MANAQKWRQKKFEETIKYIQKELRGKMGLLVDIPKPGYGTTIDGNTASRFFDQSAVASSIAGIAEQLIMHLNVILQTILCRYAVDVQSFRKYAKATAEEYVNRDVDQCPWYNMPSNLHKLLIHLVDIKSAVLPVGIFSEEALEARNKDFRRYRE